MQKTVKGGSGLGRAIINRRAKAAKEMADPTTVRAAETMVELTAAGDRHRGRHEVSHAGIQPRRVFDDGCAGRHGLYGW